MEPIKVLVVDDHTLFRRGVGGVLAGVEGLGVVGEASDGREAIEKVGQLNPNVVLMDLMMPRCSGLDAIRTLQAEGHRTNVMVLTVSEREGDLFAAMKAGARGYMLKSSEPEDLVRAVQHVAQGGVIVSPLMAAKMLTEFKGEGGGDSRPAPAEAKDSGLSPREVEVLQLVAQGATNRMIADSLVISDNTVKTHLRNIMEKLHLANRSQAAAYAVRSGLADMTQKTGAAISP